MENIETKKKFRQALRDGLELIQEGTLYRLSLYDEEYQESLSEFGKAETAYMKIQDDLEAKYGEIINDYLSTLQAHNCDTNDLCYISGLIDMFRFLNRYGFIKRE